MDTTTMVAPRTRSNRKHYGARPGTELPKPRARNPRPTTATAFDITRALKLRMINKLSYQDIANVFGLSKQAIQSRLQSHIELFEDPELTAAYVEHKEKVFAGAESRFLVASLDPEKLANASTLQLVTSAGIMYDKQRLERGLSTENISVRSLLGSLNNDLEELKLKREKLTHELHSMNDTVGNLLITDNQPEFVDIFEE